MSSGKTGQQKWAEQQAGSPVPGGLTAQSQAQQGNQNALVGAAQGTLNQFEGPVQQSPFYKALLNTGISSTSKAYDNARTNMMRNAQAAGFGYNQPITQGAGNQIQAQEASDLGSLPDREMVAAAPLSLQAAQQSGQLAVPYAQEALGYSNQALDANAQAARLQQQRQQQQQALWASIASAGQNLFNQNPYGIFGSP